MGRPTKRQSITKQLMELNTEDYQNRGSNRPRSDIPVGISVYEYNGICIECSFKSTSEEIAKQWLERKLESIIGNYKKVEYKIYTQQEGDYNNDWVASTTKIIFI